MKKKKHAGHPGVGMGKEHTEHGKDFDIRDVTSGHGIARGPKKMKTKVSMKKSRRGK